MTQEIKNEFCDECSCMLTDCGVFGVDGLPTQDCKVCQISNKLKELRLQSDNLAMLVLRLSRALKSKDADNKVASQALDYLERQCLLENRKSAILRDSGTES